MADLKINRDINYINKDFSQFREQLINYSQTYFPNTYTDFSETSPGMMFMEQVAYVGDILSFYLDNQFQENFLQYSRQSENIYDLAYMFGYKPKLTSTSQTTLDIFQEVPSVFVSGEFQPDFQYCLTLDENTVFNSTTGIKFISEDKLDFTFSSSFSPTEITVAEVLNGQPIYYQLKKQLKVISSEIQTTQFDVNGPTPFQTFKINNDNIVGILDIFDSDGNEWSEVDYLGQEMVFDSVKNTNVNDPNSNKSTPYLLKLKKVSRRFISRVVNSNEYVIQFGVGSPSDTTEEIIPNPNNVGIGLPFKKDKLTTAYSPTNFLYTGTYGIAPSNTVLTVRYLIGGGVLSNVDANSITSLTTPQNLKFTQREGINQNTGNYVFNSFNFTNPNAATGGGGKETLEEIRQNTMMMAATQKRAITPNDYLVRALSMPANFGTISKAHIELPKVKDNQVSTIETLNLFVLTQNSTGQLSYPNKTIKNNLRTYLSQYRMIGDNIEIRNAFIINIQIDFEIIVLPGFSNSEVLIDVISKLKNHFQINKWQINQPIFIRNLYVMVDQCKGVQTVNNISISNKAGSNSGYSEFSYDIPTATQNNVIYPSLDPSIFELRYPDSDIRGRVVSL